MRGDSLSSSDRARVCPRCGKPSDGAAWCPKCGLNLRLERPPTFAAAPPELPATASPSAAAGPVVTESVRPRRGWAPIVAIGLAAVAVAGAVAAVVLVTHTSNGSKELVVRRASAGAAMAPPTRTVVAPAALRVTVTVPAASAPAITATQMGQVLQLYVNAYGNESVDGLRGLFANDLVRTNGGEPTEDLDRALETYRGQFAQLSHPVYRLTNIDYEPGRATATATYSITSDNGGGGAGRIRYHFARAGDRVLIDQLVIQPS